MWLRSGIAAAVVYADSYSTDSTPSLGTYICHRHGPKKTPKKKKNRKESVDLNIGKRKFPNYSIKEGGREKLGRKKTDRAFKLYGK